MGRYWRSRLAKSGCARYADFQWLGGDIRITCLPMCCVPSRAVVASPLHC